MAEESEESAGQEADAVDAGKKKMPGKVIVLFIGGPVLLVILLVAAYFLFFSGGGDKEEAKADEHHAADAKGHGKKGDHDDHGDDHGDGHDDHHGDNHGADYDSGPKEHPPLRPEDAIFFEMPDILVNLNTPDKRQVYLKLKVALELHKEANVDALTEGLPRVIDKFQVYLREMRVEDLSGSAGLFRLKEELLRRVNAATHPIHVYDVLFKEMLIQ